VFPFKVFNGDAKESEALVCTARERSTVRALIDVEALLGEGGDT
jgi:hypothetical protein